MGEDQRDERQAKRRRFAIAFRELLTARGLSQVAFAEQYRVAASTVNQWATGRSVPDPDDIFDLEAWFGLRPGGLSETLGYVPVEALTTTIEGTEATIEADPLLPDWGRRLLLTSYREIVSSRDVTRRRD